MPDKEKYKIALFLIIRNSQVLPVGEKLGKTDKEINKMAYDTMQELLKMINYEEAEKLYKEGYLMYQEWMETIPLDVDKKYK